jgi:hypothetical protein
MGLQRRPRLATHLTVDLQALLPLEGDDGILRESTESAVGDPGSRHHFAGIEERLQPAYRGTSHALPKARHPSFSLRGRSRPGALVFNPERVGNSVDARALLENQ